MTDLTPYQQEKFAHLERIEEGKKWKIDPNRPDREEFIVCLKLYADTWHTLEFNEDYTAFKRVYPAKTMDWVFKQPGHWDTTVMIDNEETMRRVMEYLDRKKL